MGLQITSTLLAQITTGFRARFATGLSRAPEQWREFATETTSTNYGEIYNFDMPQGTLREWIGERKVTQLKAQELEIRNKSYELTFEVDRDAIEDDRYSQYGTEAEYLGDAAARHPNKLIFDLIKGGFTANAFDGQFFYDTDHPVGAGVVSNKGTAALSSTTYGTVRAAMMAFTDESGEPLNVVPNTLLVSPQQEVTGRQILNQELTAGGENNVWFNSATLIVSPYLTDANDWFLFDTSKVLKPFIFQRRRPPQLVQQTAPTDAPVFNNKKLRFGVDYRAGAGYALWQLAYGNAVP